MKSLEEFMGDRYDPPTFWSETGAVYWKRGIPKSPEHVEQEKLLTRLLTPMPFESVLDVGCGGGRIGRLIKGIRPSAEYTGVDISDQALKVARSYLPKADLIQSSVQDFEPTERWDTRHKWDLVLTCEVLMHIEPPDIEAVVSKLMRAARMLFIVEWLPTSPPEEIAAWNWPHDYEALGFGKPIARTGEQAVYLWTP